MIAREEINEDNDWELLTLAHHVTLIHLEYKYHRTVHVTQESDRGWFGRPAGLLGAHAGLWPRTHWRVLVS